MTNPTLLTYGITITDIIKKGRKDKPEIALSNIIDAVPLSNIIDAVVQVGIQHGIEKGTQVIDIIRQLQEQLILADGTPFWKRMLNGLAVAFVTAISDGKLTLTDLPKAIEIMYTELNKK